MRGGREVGKMVSCFCLRKGGGEGGREGREGWGREMSSWLRSLRASGGWRRNEGWREGGREGRVMSSWL